MLKYLSVGLFCIASCSSCAHNTQVVSDDQLAEGKVLACTFKDDKLYCMDFLNFMNMLKDREDQASKPKGIWEQERYYK